MGGAGLRFVAEVPLLVRLETAEGRVVVDEEREVDALLAAVEEVWAAFAPSGDGAAARPAPAGRPVEELPEELQRGYG